jgi:hypothetical protein
MSSYRFSSPIDVQSNAASAPGTLNIFNGSGSNSSLRAPSVLTANRAFILPASLGIPNSYIKYDGTNVQFGAGVPNTTSLPINVEISNTNVSNPATTTGITFLTVANINWRGTATEGTPSAVYALINSTSTPGEVRLFNRTGATVAAIASVGVIGTQTIVPVPITGGFTAGANIIDVQIRRSGGIPGLSMTLSAIQIVP